MNGDEGTAARVAAAAETAPSAGAGVAAGPPGLSPEELRAVAEAVRGVFPRPSHATQLVLIDVDPRRLHAFWNITREQLDRARAALADEDGAARLVLRLVAVDDGMAALDVPVQGLQSQTYVEVWDAPRRYRATLGLRGEDGSFCALVSSNLLELPALGPAAAAPADDGAAASGETATGEPAPPLAEPPAEAELPLERVLAGSSSTWGRGEDGFEVNAELHVFGRARVDAELRLFGQRVPLRPDGSFSITRPLPHGSFLLTALLADFATSSE